MAKRSAAGQGQDRWGTSGRCLTEARGSIPYGPTNVCSGGEDGWGGKKEQTIVSVWRVGKINPEGDGGGVSSA